MGVNKPALTGGGSVVGFARESAWGTVPTTGSDPNKAFGNPAHFFLVKEESFDVKPSADPQMDDLDQNREIGRIIAHGNLADGSIRANVGPESIGWLLTMLFGTPSSSKVLDSSGSDNDVYTHIWYPGVNAERDAWPAPMSFESRLDTYRSKIISGALMRQLDLECPNNAAIMATADFGLAKKIQIVQGAGTSGIDDASGDDKPCIITANPTMISENEWHWKQIKAYPQLYDADAESITSMSFTLGFPDLHGIFTGGSGQNVGTYGVDKFQASGRLTMLFEDETMFYKIKDGLYFEIDATWEGATIQGANKETLNILVYSAKAGQAGLINKVGDLEYDIPWSARRDPTEGKSVQITLTNSVISYAA